ncbi:MAG: hypothetical protein WCT29_02230 [Candidatus Paceibacterota bacterium]|jgi:hypothetical protein
MLWYLVFFVLGVAAALVSPAGSTKESLQVIEAVSLTALLASLYVPFAGFAKNEKWQKFVLQNVACALFGVYAVVVYEDGSFAGVLALVVVSSMHFAYWTSSIHSRNYRLEQFRMGFAPRMPMTARFVAMLNAQGRAHQADIIVSCTLSGKMLPGWDFARGLELPPGCWSWIHLVDAEMTNVFTPPSGAVDHP